MEGTVMSSGWEGIGEDFGRVFRGIDGGVW